MKHPKPTPPPRKDAPNGGPGRLASEGEPDGTVDPNDSGGKPVPTIEQPELDPRLVPPPNTGARP